MSMPRPCLAVLVDDGGDAKPCPDHAQPGGSYCAAHTGPMRLRRPENARESVLRWALDVEQAIRKRMEAGTRTEHDPDLERALAPLALPLYSLWWRVETDGIENIPTEGPALLAANHSGTLPLDGAMLKLAVLKEHGRSPWLLAGDLVFEIPLFRDLVRMTGNARADREESASLLRSGELLGVFPEGYKGIGKGWAKRYQLQRFGRGGFVELCLETGAPVIPVAIIGAEEAYPMVANLGFLARRLGLPYVPVTPTWPLLGPLGLIPLPSKWIIAFGEPIPMIDYGPDAAQDTQLVLELTEQVRRTVQGLINSSLPKRRRTYL